MIQGYIVLKRPASQLLGSYQQMSYATSRQEFVDCSAHVRASQRLMQRFRSCTLGHRDENCQINGATIANVLDAIQHSHGPKHDAARRYPQTG